MNLIIENIPELKMAYVRRVGPYGAENIQTMEYLKAWADENHFLHEDTVILGIARDNPQVTLPENCRYDTCLVVDTVSQALVSVALETAVRPQSTTAQDPTIYMGTTPHGKYAVFLIPHTLEGVESAWQNIFPSLSREALEFDPSRPIVERYAAKKINQHLCEICVPIL